MQVDNHTDNIVKNIIVQFSDVRAIVTHLYIVSSWEGFICGDPTFASRDLIRKEELFVKEQNKKHKKGFLFLPPKYYVNTTHYRHMVRPNCVGDYRYELHMYYYNEQKEQLTLNLIFFNMAPNPTQSLQDFLNSQVLNISYIEHAHKCTKKELEIT